MPNSDPELQCHEGETVLHPMPLSDRLITIRYKGT